MTINDMTRDETYNNILTEKQQKYQHYHQIKLVYVNFLQEKIFW